MRSCFTFFFTLFFGCLFAQNAGQSFKNPIVVSNADSVQYFEGQYISIVGPIIDTKEFMHPQGVIGYLNMFREYPNNPFDITIARKSMGFFIPLDQYKDKHLKLTGKVTSFVQKQTKQKRYVIRLTNLKQIEVLN